MGKKGSAGQRGKKKHEKEQKRKQAVAKKQAARAASALRTSQPTRNPLELLVREGFAGATAGRDLPYFDGALALALHDEENEDGPRLPPQAWTPTRVDRLSTAEIQDRLAQLGIHTDPAAFTAATGGSRSAVEHATSRWIPLLPAGSDAHARDFACFAACALWKRWRAEAPSREMLTERIVLQEFADDHGRFAEAVEHGQQLWSLLQKVLIPEIRTCELADALLGRPGALSNWAPEFAITARAAAHHDPEAGRPAAATLAEVLARFPDEPDDWTLPLVYSRAELIYEAVSREEGERILRDQIAAHPTRAGAYVTLADLWEHDEKKQQALHLLEEAAARPVQDGDDWDLAGRIEELREAVAASGA